MQIKSRQHRWKSPIVSSIPGTIQPATGIYRARLHRAQIRSLDLFFLPFFSFSVVALPLTAK